MPDMSFLPFAMGHYYESSQMIVRPGEKPPEEKNNEFVKGSLHIIPPGKYFSEQLQ